MAVLIVTTRRKEIAGIDRIVHNVAFRPGFFHPSSERGVVSDSAYQPIELLVIFGRTAVEMILRRGKLPVGVSSELQDLYGYDISGTIESKYIG
jgi:hypothetical protein